MAAFINSTARGTFENYRLDTTLPIFRFFAVFVSAFNLLLLIPDLINLNGQPVWLLIVARVLFSAVLISSLFWIKTIRHLILRSVVVTIFEIFALSIFLYVFCLYPQADFFIQTLGVMAIIMVIFVVPNMWLLAVGVSAVSAAAYLVLAKLTISMLEPNHFYPVLVYMAFEITVGAIFAMLFRRYQYREFVAKTELERIYSTDSLTRIGNRVKLEEEADKWFASCEKYNLPLCLALLDVDNLKQINDNHGHLVGDTVLYETAQILRANLRRDDVCVRWGGDEFILLLPRTSVDAAQTLAARIKDVIKDYEFSARIGISCSFGITQMQKGQSLEQLIAQADASMYLAKKRGKNTIEVGDAVSP